MKKFMGKRKLAAILATILFASALLVSGTYALTNDLQLLELDDISPSALQAAAAATREEDKTPAEQEGATPAPEQVLEQKDAVPEQVDEPPAEPFVLDSEDMIVSTADDPDALSESVTALEDSLVFAASKYLKLSIVNSDARHVDGAVIMKHGEVLRLKATTTKDGGALRLVQWLVYESKNQKGWYTFQPYVNGDVSRADIRVERTAPVGDLCIVIIGYSENDYAYMPIIVIPDDAKGFASSVNGGSYCNIGDNTYREVITNYGATPKETTVVIGDYICAGTDEQINTSDDREDVIVSDGRKYLGPNVDQTYRKAGANQMLGTSQDIFVKQKDTSKPISPANEAEVETEEGSETPAANSPTPTPTQKPTVTPTSAAPTPTPKGAYMSTNQWRIPPKLNAQGTMTTSGYIFVRPGDTFDVQVYPSNAVIYDLFYLVELQKAVSAGKTSTSYVQWSKQGLTKETLANATTRFYVDGTVPMWDTFGIAVSTAAGDKIVYDQLIVVPAHIRNVVIDNDKVFLDFGSNAYQQLVINASSLDLRPPFSAGYDQIPNTADDRHDFIVSGSTRYLGPNNNGTYQKAGADGKLGTADDALYIKIDPSQEISPNNETPVTNEQTPTPSISNAPTPTISNIPTPTVTKINTPTPTPTSTNTVKPKALTGMQVFGSMVRTSVSFWQRVFVNIFR